LPARSANGEIFTTEGNGVPSQTPPEGELPTDEQIIDIIRKGRTAVQCLQAMNAVGPSSKYTLDISIADARLHETARICLHMIVADLCDKSRWIRNAESQELFGKRLEAALGQIRACMRALYGIAGHRPTKNAQRDAEIWYLKEDKHLTFGQIGLKLKIARTAAERAHQRHEKRMEEMVGAMSQVLEFGERWSMMAYEAIRTVAPDRAIPPVSMPKRQDD
jgi:hypothetical protein